MSLDTIHQGGALNIKLYNIHEKFDKHNFEDLGPLKDWESWRVGRCSCGLYGETNSGGTRFHRVDIPMNTFDCRPDRVQSNENWLDKYTINIRNHGLLQDLMEYLKFALDDPKYPGVRSYVRGWLKHLQEEGNE